MRKIPVSNGKYHALVDDEDADLVLRHTWHVQRDSCNTYAYTNIPIPGKRRPNGKQDYSRVAMHRLVLGVTGHRNVVDHADGDGLNNRRSNLRKCDQTLNNANKRHYNRLGVKGVCHRQRCPFRPYVAYIQCRGKRRDIGYFATIEEAARAYDAEARRLFGEFAKTNF